MFDDRRAEDLKEKILVGFLVLPTPTGFLLSFRTRANSNKDQAVGFSLLERAPQSLAGELRSVDANGITVDFETLGLPGIEPRPAIFCVPGPRPVCQFHGPAFQLPAARIT